MRVFFVQSGTVSHQDSRTKDQLLLKCRCASFLDDAERGSNEGGMLWLLGILRVVVCRWVEIAQ
jgi:hypothetical protein